MKSSELFESEVYLEEVSDVMCIAQAGKIALVISDTCYPRTSYISLSYIKELLHYYGKLWFQL